MRTLQSSKGPSSREKIIRAATTLFAEKGFEGTTTRHIASKARVNEITVYRLFRNKQDLYVQVLDHELRLKVPERLLPSFQSADEPEAVFLSLAERLEELFDPTFLRLLFYAALEKPDLLRKHHRPDLVSFYQVLADHIRQRINSEILRDLDPILMGRALVGMIAYHQIVRELLVGPDFPGCDIPAASRVYTDIWLRGALAPNGFTRAYRTEASAAHVQAAAATSA